jgi:hypothetical protein
MKMTPRQRISYAMSFSKIMIDLFFHSFLMEAARFSQLIDEGFGAFLNLKNLASVQVSGKL